MKAIRWLGVLVVLLPLSASPAEAQDPTLSRLPALDVQSDNPTTERPSAPFAVRYRRAFLGSIVGSSLGFALGVAVCHSGCGIGSGEDPGVAVGLIIGGAGGALGTALGVCKESTSASCVKRAIGTATLGALLGVGVAALISRPIKRVAGPIRVAVPLLVFSATQAGFTVGLIK